MALLFKLGLSQKPINKSKPRVTQHPTYEFADELLKRLLVNKIMLATVFWLIRWLKNCDRKCSQISLLIDIEFHDFFRCFPTSRLQNNKSNSQW